jgi:RNA polymerase sigma factor (sigma-70 family)
MRTTIRATESMVSSRNGVTSLGDALASCRAQALIAARRLVGRQDAEDVVQEATTRVLRAASGGAEIKHPGAYLRAAVQRAAADHLTTRARLPAAALTDLADNSNPHRIAETHALLEEIARLPAAQRTALVGTVLGNHDQTQLASALGTTPAGVRQLVRRARIRLRDTVGAWIPWLVGRAHDLTSMSTFAATSAGQSSLAGLAVAAVIAPPLIQQPPRPAPPHPMNTHLQFEAPIAPRLGTRPTTPAVPSPRLPATRLPTRVAQPQPPRPP